MNRWGAWECCLYRCLDGKPVSLAAGDPLHFLFSAAHACWPGGNQQQVSKKKRERHGPHCKKVGKSKKSGNATKAHVTAAVPRARLWAQQARASATRASRPKAKPPVQWRAPAPLARRRRSQAGAAAAEPARTGGLHRTRGPTSVLVITKSRVKEKEAVHMAGDDKKRRSSVRTCVGAEVGEVVGATAGVAGLTAAVGAPAGLAGPVGATMGLTAVVGAPAGLAGPDGAATGLAAAVGAPAGLAGPAGPATGPTGVAGAAAGVTGVAGATEGAIGGLVVGATAGAKGEGLEAVGALAVDGASAEGLGAATAALPNCCVVG
jgi:hypothetical protein